MSDLTDGLGGTGYVTTTTILDSTIAAADIADSVITSTKLIDSTIVSQKLIDSTIVSQKLIDSTLQSIKYADSSITTRKIDDSAVTALKLADDAVAIRHLAKEYISKRLVVTVDSATDQSSTFSYGVTLSATPVVAGILHTAKLGDSVFPSLTSVTDTQAVVRIKSVATADDTVGFHVITMVP